VSASNPGTVRSGIANITLRVAGRLVDREPVGAMAPGGMAGPTMLEWATTGFASGDHAYELSVEAADGPGDSFPDTNRISGILELLAPMPRPDIALGGISGLYRTARAGAVLAIEVVVANIGDGDAGGSAMYVSLENASGKSLLFTTVQLVELDETNNRLSWNMTLQGAAAAAPRLRVTAVRVDGVLEDGGTVTIVAEVSNTGAANITGAIVELFIDGKLANTRALEPVGGNAARSCSMKWTVAAGRHTLKIAVSVDGEYGISGQLPVTVRYGVADDAGQARGFALGSVLMFMALAAVIIIVGRPKRPPAGRLPAKGGE
jgi:hypothetical protein